MDLLHGCRASLSGNWTLERRCFQGRNSGQITFHEMPLFSFILSILWLLFNSNDSQLE